MRRLAVQRNTAGICVFDVDGTIVEVFEPHDERVRWAKARDKQLLSTVVQYDNGWGKLVLYRPSVPIFMEKLLRHGCDLAIWSLNEENYVKQVLRMHPFYSTVNWKFVWSKSVTDKTEPLRKDLQKVYDLFPQYRPDRVILYDDDKNQTDYNRSRNFAAVLVKRPELISLYKKGSDFFGQQTLPWFAVA